MALFRHFLCLLNQLVDPTLGQVQFRHDILDIVSRFGHLERPGEARVGGIPLSPDFLIVNSFQGGLGGTVMSGVVVSLVGRLYKYVRIFFYHDWKRSRDNLISILFSDII